jgi:hypothetical protein
MVVMPWTVENENFDVVFLDENTWNERTGNAARNEGEKRVLP